MKKKTPEQCSDEVAKKHGYKDWYHVILEFKFTDMDSSFDNLKTLENESSELYASQFKPVWPSDEEIKDKWPITFEYPSEINTANTLRTEGAKWAINKLKSQYDGEKEGVI